MENDDPNSVLVLADEHHAHSNNSDFMFIQDAQNTNKRKTDAPIQGTEVTVHCCLQWDDLL